MRILILFLYFFVAISAVSYRKMSLIIMIGRKKHEYIYFLYFFILFLLAALRPENSDNDYLSYLNAYNIISDGNIVNIEPTFYVIVNIVKYIFNNSLFLFIIYAMLGVTLKCIAIKQLSEFWLLSLLIYISHIYLLHEITQIRVGVATGLILLAIKPMYERDIKRFLCYALFAFLFHYSAILVLLLWFIPTHSVNRWFYVLLIPVVYLLYFCNVSFLSLVKLIPIGILQKKISMYIALTKMGETHNTHNIFNVMQLMRCGLAFLFLWKLPLLKQSNRYIPILLQCYIWSIVILVIFQDLPVFAFRISDLLGCVEIILVPCVLYIFKSKPLAMIFVQVMSLGIFLVNVFKVKLLVN